ncbi:hypothetical protein Tco_0309587 [Tanacetum coccineum]
MSAWSLLAIFENPSMISSVSSLLGPKIGESRCRLREMPIFDGFTFWQDPHEYPDCRSVTKFGNQCTSEYLIFLLDKQDRAPQVDLGARATGATQVFRAIEFPMGVGGIPESPWKYLRKVLNYWNFFKLFLLRLVFRLFHSNLCHKDRTSLQQLLLCFGTRDDVSIGTRGPLVHSVT